jgi:hypothetical protein
MPRGLQVRPASHPKGVVAREAGEIKTKLLKKNGSVFRIQVKAGVNDFGHLKAHTANGPEV